MMDCLDEYNASVSSESFSSCTTDDIFRTNGGEFRADPSIRFDDQRPTKLMKTSSDSWGSSSNINDSASASSTSNLLSFSNPSNASEANYQYYKGLMLKPKHEVDYEPVINDIQVKESQKSHRINCPSTSNSLSQDHVIAERRRRQKLSQKLIALSALIPGLKKVS